MNMRNGSYERTHMLIDLDQREWTVRVMSDLLRWMLGSVNILSLFSD